MSSPKVVECVTIDPNKCRFKFFYETTVQGESTHYVDLYWFIVCGEDRTDAAKPSPSVRYFDISTCHLVPDVKDMWTVESRLAEMRAYLEAKAKDVT